MNDQRRAARERVLRDTAAWIRRTDWSEAEEPQAESLAGELESRADENEARRTVIDVPLDGDGFPLAWSTGEDERQADKARAVPGELAEDPGGLTKRARKRIARRAHRRVSRALTRL